MSESTAIATWSPDEAPAEHRPGASMKRPLIAVYGSSTIRETDPEYGLARDLGRALAEGGAYVMTGGYGGAMEACSRGCHEAGGHVVGVTVELFEARGPANR